CQQLAANPTIVVLVCQVVTVAPPLRAVNAMIRVAVKVLVCFMPSFVCGVSPAMAGSRGVFFGCLC
ncbi:hypothetical protein, partial [Mobiluncus mulieris]|uniref:hypothetical protein n=1 Tax=Mobiluncus mulieris TaxID=2052 RepID=UPI00019F94D4